MILLSFSYVYSTRITFKTHILKNNSKFKGQMNDNDDDPNRDETDKFYLQKNRESTILVLR
jgi:hypothetical protein